jgi:hypothetical protein
VLVYLGAAVREGEKMMRSGRECGRRLRVFALAILAMCALPGEFMATIEDGCPPAGRHQIVWNDTDAAGRELPSGV